MNLRERLLSALSLAFICGGSPALADWIVAQVSQPARYAVDGTLWHPLVAGMEVPNHAWIHTGRTGRLLLRNDDETIQFKPNTVAAVSRRVEDGADVTTILQKFGSILFDVSPRLRRSRAVETPFLAAIVKGTRFSVDVDSGSSQVRVQEGVVRALHPTLGQQADITTGQVAIAQGNRRFAVRGGGSGAARITPAEQRAPRVGAAVSARSTIASGAGRRGFDFEIRERAEGRDEARRALEDWREDVGTAPSVDREDRENRNDPKDRNEPPDRDDPMDRDDLNDGDDQGDREIPDPDDDDPAPPDTPEPDESPPAGSVP